MANEFLNRRWSVTRPSNRNLILEIDRLRTLIDRLRSRPDNVDRATLRTYEDMLDSRLRMLEDNI